MFLFETEHRRLSQQPHENKKCFQAQAAPSTLQSFNRRKCAFLLRDLAATAPQCTLFSATSGPDSQATKSTPSQPQSTLKSSCIPRGIQIRPHFSFQTPGSHCYCRSSRQAPASQCSAVALSLDGPRSYHGRISHPESVNCELGTYTLGD